MTQALQQRTTKTSENRRNITMFRVRHKYIKIERSNLKRVDCTAVSGDDFLVIWKLNGRNPRFWNATAEQIRADVPKLSLSSLLPHRPRIFDLSPPPPLQLCRLRLSAQTRCLHKLRIIYRYKYGGITETIKDEVILYIIWISLFHSLFHQQVVSSS